MAGCRSAPDEPAAAGSVTFARRRPSSVTPQADYRKMVFFAGLRDLPTQGWLMPVSPSSPELVAGHKQCRTQAVLHLIVPTLGRPTPRLYPQLKSLIPSTGTSGLASCSQSAAFKPGFQQHQWAGWKLTECAGAIREGGYKDAGLKCCGWRLATALTSLCATAPS
jgi:hypothetical protein